MTRTEPMVAIAPLVGFVVAPVAAVVVYADATRRDLPDRARLRWALGVGVASFGGFLVPSVLGDPLVRTYLHVVKSRPVVTAPREILLLHVAVGVAIAAGAIVLYAAGSRVLTRERGSSSDS